MKSKLDISRLAFMNASADLLKAALQEAVGGESEAVSAIETLLRAGGMLELTARLAPLTKQASIQVAVVAPNGERIQITGCTLEKETVQ